VSERPWGPHGAEVPDNSVRPNPTAPSPVQQFGGGQEVAAPVAGGGGGLGGVLAQIVFSLVLLMLLWIPMACLYPVTALAGIASGAAIFRASERLLPPDARDVALALGFVVAAVAVLKVYRIEYRLAEKPAFRAVRHAVRMLLLGVWAIPILELSMGATGPSTSTGYILTEVRSPRALAAFLKQPRNLALWVAALVGLHLLLWSGKSVRRWWHRRLKFIGLK
jgi:hypothetical protein